MMIAIPIKIPFGIVLAGLSTSLAKVDGLLVTPIGK